MYSFSSNDSIQILKVDDLLNPLENQKIIQEVEQFIEDGSSNFIVDLSPMKFMNSNGLTFLISLLTRSRSAGGEVIIANLSENIKKILLITRLQSAFKIADNLDEAVELFSFENTQT